MATKEVYVPVAVTIEDGRITDMHTDFEGAPWSFVDSQENVWNADTEEWDRDGDLEDQAIDGIALACDLALAWMRSADATSYDGANAPAPTPEQAQIRLARICAARDYHADTGAYPAFPNGPGADQAFDDWAADVAEGVA